MRLVNTMGPRLEGWISKVAKDDPAEAFRLAMMCVEYVRPKLGRTELTAEIKLPPLTTEERIARAQAMGLTPEMIFGKTPRR